MTRDLEDKSPRYDVHGRLTFLAAGRGYVMCRRPGHAPFTLPRRSWDGMAGNPLPCTVEAPWREGRVWTTPFTYYEPQRPADASPAFDCGGLYSDGYAHVVFTPTDREDFFVRWMAATERDPPRFVWPDNIGG